MAAIETSPPLITWIDAPPKHIEEINTAPPIHADLQITTPQRSQFDHIWEFDRCNVPYASFTEPAGYHLQSKTNIIKTLDLEPLYEITRRPLHRFCETFDHLLAIVEDIQARAAMQKP